MLMAKAARSMGRSTQCSGLATPGVLQRRTAAHETTLQIDIASGIVQRELKAQAA